MSPIFLDLVASSGWRFSPPTSGLDGHDWGLLRNVHVILTPHMMYLVAPKANVYDEETMTGDKRAKDEK